MSYFCSIETSKVKTGKFVAGSEHLTHICNILSVEIPNVKTGKVDTTIKHTSHISNL